MDPTPSAAHWDAAYDLGDVTRSWYQTEADQSLALIRAGHPEPGALVDVGGGASTLVDGLLVTGWTDITVTDISAVGMTTAQERLGPAAATVAWVQADVRTWRPSRTWAVWHDRAVLHFMTDPQDLAGYHRALVAGTVPGSVIVIGCFGPEGPTSCSGLPVTRYDANTLAEFLGPAFAVERTEIADHATPAGGSQQFLWVLARRR